MTKSYAQIVKQIDNLKLQAEKMRKSEIAGVTARIREAIDFYGLTAADLGFGRAGAAKSARGAGQGAAKTPRRRRGSAAAKTPAVVKYRNDSGGTWGGRGKRPQWLRDALAEGKQLSDFLVK